MSLMKHIAEGQRKFYSFRSVSFVLKILIVVILLVGNVTTAQTGSGKQPGKEKEDRLQWKRPRFEERRHERNAMVVNQIQRGSIPIKDRNVLKAMRLVPRHLFVPKPLQAVAYADRPLPIGSGQTISQPFIVAYMTEALNLQPGEKVLEIGTGSGYQAAVLSEITPNVFSIEIIKELGRESSQRLNSLGYKTIKVKFDDGYHGWEEHAPFDAIIVTCAAGHVPPPLVAQLKSGGRMMIPVGGVYDIQMLTKVIKNEDGELRTRQLIPVRFVPMTGKSLKK